MPNLKDLKNRISSVKSTRKITKAMQMVAAAKLRRAEEAVENARPYADKFHEVLGNLAASVGDSDTAPKLLNGTGSDQTHLLLVLTSERGLCGGFNASIVKRARNHTQNLLDNGKTVKIATVGKKGREQLRRYQGERLIEHFDLSEAKRPGYEHAQMIASNILERFDNGEFDICSIFYGRFESVMTQVPTDQQIIPASFDEEDVGERKLYEYEPNEEGVLRELLPRGITSQIFAALLENTASEHGARMTAMDNATRNADEMVEDLEREYNRTRQAVITNELIEIIAGAEAV